MSDEKNDEKNDCTICYDENNDSSVKLRCCHSFHEECLLNVFNLWCPLCRTDINKEDVSPNIYESILKNKDRVRLEFEVEDREEILRDIRNNRSISNLSIKDEFTFAFRYLSRFGIPDKFFPEKIEIKAPVGVTDINTQLHVPPGFYFNATIQNVLYHLETVLDSPTRWSEEQSSSNFDDDETHDESDGELDFEINNSYNIPIYAIYAN